MARYHSEEYLGVGIVLNGDGLVGVDLDHCVVDGKPDSSAIQIMEEIGCKYVEISPSGTGLRGIGYSSCNVSRKGVYMGINTELYWNKRYLTITGHALITGSLQELSGYESVTLKISSSSCGLEGLEREIAFATLGSSGTSDSSISSGTSGPSDSSISSKTSDSSNSFDSSCTSETSDSSATSVSSVSSVNSFEIPEKYIPQAEGQRNRKLFHLARYLKGVLADPTKDELREIVAIWHGLALQNITTKDFFLSWAEFNVAWNRVKQPYGIKLNKIMENLPQLFPEHHGVAEYGSECAHLMRVCLALQADAGDSEFFLDVRTAGSQIDRCHTHAASLLRVLVTDNYLALIEKGSPGRAARYRVIFHPS